MYAVPSVIKMKLDSDMINSSCDRPTNKHAIMSLKVLYAYVHNSNFKFTNVCTETDLHLHNDYGRDITETLP